MLTDGITNNRRANKKEIKKEKLKSEDSGQL